MIETMYFICISLIAHRRQTQNGSVNRVHYKRRAKLEHLRKHLFYKV